MDWKNELLDALDELSTLEKNWNGYDAVPIYQSILEDAKRIVNGLYTKMKLFPTPAGGVQFECEKGTGKYFEAEVFLDHIEILVIDEYGQEEEFSIDLDVNKLNDELSIRGW